MTTEEIPSVVRSIFLIAVRAELGIDEAAAMRALRRLLKRMLRDHGLRCLSVAEVVPDEPDEAAPVPALDESMDTGKDGTT